MYSVDARTAIFNSWWFMLIDFYSQSSYATMTLENNPRVEIAELTNNMCDFSAGKGPSFITLTYWTNEILVSPYDRLSFITTL